MKTRWMAGLMALVVSSGLLMIGTPAANASSAGRKNTTLALGAGAIYSLLTGKTTQGLILGAGTAYAYKRYQDAHKDEQRRARYYSTRYSRSPRSTRYRTYRAR
jgi:uncharacterized membrane protein YebE (DUF533 family)